MKGLQLARTAALLLAVSAFAGQRSASADLVDNFNGENSGNAQLNYFGFANWNVTAGSVDLIGNGSFDFYPGTGLYVDLNGSTGVSGTLASKATFTPGTYNLSFTIGNNPGNSSPNSVTVSLGNYSETFTETGSVPESTVNRVITLTSTSTLIFATPASDSDNFGVIIDNVQLTASTAVPEPSTLALAGLGLVSVAVRRWRKRG